MATSVKINDDLKSRVKQLANVRNRSAHWIMCEAIQDYVEYHFFLLKTEPEIGRPFEDLPELRELIIPFGESDYVALYIFEKDVDCVYILAFRHQKEVGYK